MADEETRRGSAPSIKLRFHFAFPGAKELVKDEFQIDTKARVISSRGQWLTHGERYDYRVLRLFFFRWQGRARRYKTEFEGLEAP